MKQSSKINISILCAFIFFCTHTVFSQTASTQPLFDYPQISPKEALSDLYDSSTGLPKGITEQVTVRQIPSIPKPGETVSIQITSFSTDFNKAQITWSIDGRVLTSQIGATTLQFQAPQRGQSSVVQVSIVKEGGGTITRSFTINPADVDLLYEADTYAHPFFKGKKEATNESLITYIAVPHFVTSSGQTIPSSNLVYTWKINGKVQESMSGYGQNIMRVQGSLIERTTQIAVDVSAINSTLKATQSIIPATTVPEVTLYENNPILGVVYEKAIEGTFLLNRPRVDFEGVPYFFSAAYKNDSNLNYAWSINGVRVTSKAANENYLVLQNDKNQEGTASVNVSLSHLQKILQNAKSSLELDFKKVENTNTNEEFTF